MNAKMSVFLEVIAIATALSLIIASAFVSPAFALKRYFNCVTEIANKSGKLNIADVNGCYDKEFHGSSHTSSSGSTSNANGK
ncbi:MAG TPA: hypothetical protein VFI73_03130 [Candidatus Nitrosopolaris sp.]|nr:hypothetical protein [Candidatus Nitrosopolaris sp.]